jgi:hypothetical protein
VIENIEDYAAVLGIELSEGRIVDNEYEWSDGDTSECSLGVRIVHKAKGIPYSEFGHALCWERGPYSIESYLTMWVWSRRKNMRQLIDFMRNKKVDFNPSEDGKSIWLWEDLSAETVGSIKAKLDSLMERWLQLWRKVGGVSALAVKGE